MRLELELSAPIEPLDPYTPAPPTPPRPRPTSSSPAPSPTAPCRLRRDDGCVIAVDPGRHPLPPGSAAEHVRVEGDLEILTLRLV